MPACSYWLTRFVILRLLGLVYLVAFLSLAHQVAPLIGENGLLPAQDLLRAAEASTGSAAGGFPERPSIFWLAGASDRLLRTLAWVGVGLSLLLLAGLGNAILLLLLWAIYISFVHVGQAFFAFGWESQLLETGFLAIFLCPLLDPRPFPRRAPPAAVLWLLRWLAFRIMLGAGLIKLRSDACWRDLTCLVTHYETQPLPNPLSRFLHAMPAWFHKVGCAFNHFVELVVPFLVFWPLRLRRAAGLLLVLFQGLLILSGNLSFLNYLTIVPCLACLDDAVWRRVLPRRLIAASERAAAAARPSRARDFATYALVAVVVILSYEPIANLLSSDQVMNTSFNPLRLVNTYGAFGAVDRERLEIIIEGTADPEAETGWKPYEFKAKPGDPARRPPIVSPYHLRLDWQIWFAAKSGPGRHPWAVHLVWKLLHGDTGALSLLASNPFPDAPPRFIRAELYRYRFTAPGDPSGAWWTREPVGPWLPPLSVHDPDLLDFLDAHGWLK